MLRSIYGTTIDGESCQTQKAPNIGLAQGAFANDNALVGFVKTTYKFFAASLLFATIGAIVGFMNFALVTDPAVRIGLIVAEIVAFLGLLFLRKSPGLNVALLFLFLHFLLALRLCHYLG